MAEAAGWSVGRACDGSQLRDEFDRLLKASGPTLLHASIEAGNAADIPKLLGDPVVLAHRFQTWLTPRLESQRLLSPPAPGGSIVSK